VRYGECDVQGVVFNAHYLQYVDVGITELWRAAFGSYGEMLARGIDLVVVQARLKFLAPARFDDELQLEVSVARLGETSVETHHRIARAEQPLVEAEMWHVFVERGTLAKTSIPTWAREGLSPWLLEPA
jgi:acyl-CoA thioester hydrolase